MEKITFRTTTGIKLITMIICLELLAIPVIVKAIVYKLLNNNPEFEVVSGIIGLLVFGIIAIATLKLIHKKNRSH